MSDEKNNGDLCLQLVRRLALAIKRHDEARIEVVRAEVEKANAESEIVKRLLPESYKIEDVFCFAVSDCWLEVRIKGKNVWSDPNSGGVGGFIAVPDPVIGWRDGRSPKDKELWL